VAEPSADSARSAITELIRSEVDQLIAIGGDGTAHLTVNTLLQNDRGHKVAFGLIPAGTGSDFARTLKLPKRLDRALNRILYASPRPIDVLSMRTDSGAQHYTLNITSAGLSGAVASAVNTKPQRGGLVYLSTTVVALRHYQPAHCRLWLDNRLFFEGEFFLIAIANGQYFGNGMRVAPRAKIDDGLADVVVIPPIPLWHLPYRLPQFMFGWHLNASVVKYGRASTIRLEPSAGTPPLELDGETISSESVTYTVHSKALKLLN
ncbi:MAG: YegS/Rv2252/BmrU family lipid kinase, partial [Gammaproteobacteria bacterium]|nr:YegS/Rv2252/BmrU family lipid kinase [Gammaproteobacteria bacterium]